MNKMKDSNEVILGVTYLQYLITHRHLFREKISFVISSQPMQYVAVK